MFHADYQSNLLEVISSEVQGPVFQRSISTNLAPVPGKQIIANPGLNIPNYREINVIPRLDCVPESTIKTII